MRSMLSSLWPRLLVVSIRCVSVKFALLEKQPLYPAAAMAAPCWLHARQIIRHAAALGVLHAALDVAHRLEDALAAQEPAFHRHVFRLAGFHAASRCSSS